MTDRDEGRTHFYGDECDPPHVDPDATIPLHVVMGLDRRGRWDLFDDEPTVDECLEWLAERWGGADQILINYHVRDLWGLDGTERVHVRCIPARYDEGKSGRGPTLLDALEDAVRAAAAEVGT